MRNRDLPNNCNSHAEVAQVTPIHIFEVEMKMEE